MVYRIYPCDEFMDAVKNCKIRYQDMALWGEKGSTTFMRHDKLNEWMQRTQFASLWNELQNERTCDWLYEWIGQFVYHEKVANLVWIQDTESEAGAIVGHDNPGLTLAIVLPNPLEELLDFAMQSTKRLHAAPFELTTSNATRPSSSAPSPQLPSQDRTVSDPSRGPFHREPEIVAGGLLPGLRWFTETMRLRVGDIIALENNEFLMSEGASTPFLVIHLHCERFHNLPEISQRRSRINWGELLYHEHIESTSAREEQQGKNREESRLDSV